jgi:hypothetical protein
MLILFFRTSTWLFIEMLATFILVILNTIIPMLMIFSSYRNIVNFYFSSTALSTSFVNCLYLFYLVQTLRSKVLSELNCRAIYYLQTSCIVVLGRSWKNFLHLLCKFILAYTVTAMHANFVLYLFSTSSPHRHHSTRTCFQSMGHCLRRFFRRFCVCLVLLTWSLSFTATIPLLYTIDSNEKSPKPVYCPGTTDINYLDEWFDRNRLAQTVLFNFIPLLISSLLSIIALVKLLYDGFVYFYFRLRMSRCSPCRNEQIESIESCRHCFSTSSLRFLLVLSSCLLACIYPIVMRFYLVYFSVFVPLIFSAINYSLGQFTSTQQPLSPIENHNTTLSTVSISKLLQTRTSIRQERGDLTNRPIELENLVDENYESFTTPPSSSSMRGKQKCFSNQLYENTRNMFK